MATDATWRYAAVDAAGARRTGRVRAATADAAEAQLRAAGLTVGQITRSRTVTLPQRPRTAAPTTDQVAAVASQLTTLHDAGLPLAATFRAAASDAPSRPISDALRRIADTLDNGAAVGDAIATGQDALGQLFCAQLAAAVAAQDISGGLDRLTADLEGQGAIDTELAAALTAPKWGAAVAATIVAAAIVYVVPLMTDVYAVVGTENLALPTRVLLGLRANAALAAVGTALVAGGIIVAWASLSAETREQLLWRTPWTGPLRRWQATHRWLLATAALHRAGRTLPDAIDAGATATTSPTISRNAAAISAQLRNGRNVRDAFAGQLDVLPSTTRSILTAGLVSPDRFNTAARAAANDLMARQRRGTAGLAGRVQGATMLAVTTTLLVALSGLWWPIFQILAER